MRFTKAEREIIENIELLLKGYNLYKDKDYLIGKSTDGSLGAYKECLVIDLRLKGNKEAIKCLVKEGWVSNRNIEIIL